MYGLLLPNAEFQKAVIEGLKHGLRYQSNKIISGLTCEFCRACVPVRVNLSKLNTARTPRKARDNRKVLQRGDALIDANHLRELKFSDKTETEISVWRHLANAHMSKRNLSNSQYTGNDQFQVRFATHSHYSEFFWKKNKDDPIGILFSIASTDSIYLSQSIYEPDHLTTMPIGKYIILSTLEKAADEGYQYAYLANWLPNSPFDYKKDLLGLEVLVNGKWTTFDLRIHNEGPSNSYTEDALERIAEQINASLSGYTL